MGRGEGGKGEEGGKREEGERGDLHGLNFVNMSLRLVFNALWLGDFDGLLDRRRLRFAATLKTMFSDNHNMHAPHIVEKDITHTCDESRLATPSPLWLLPGFFSPYCRTTNC